MPYHSITLALWVNIFLGGCTKKPTDKMYILPMGFYFKNIFQIRSVSINLPVQNATWQVVPHPYYHIGCKCRVQVQPHLQAGCYTLLPG